VLLLLTGINLKALILIRERKFDWKGFINELNKLIK